MKTTGTIKRIIGPVVDVAFENNVPDIYSALEVMRGDQKIILEVEQNIGGNTVRTVAMDSTDGLSRGMEVVNTGAPISVPVGKGTLGRMFNVLGAPIDDGKDVEGSTLPIHRKAPAYVSQATKVEILETGIKVIDLICPVLKGGKL
jgi:F-type H+-transporting ATPase subunit beta